MLPLQFRLVLIEKVWNMVYSKADCFEGDDDVFARRILKVFYCVQFQDTRMRIQ